MLVQSAKHSRRLLIALTAILFAAGFPGGATAISSVSTFGSAQYGPALATICDGDCDQRANLEARRQAAGFDLPFELGLKLLKDGLDLTIESDGNIFLYGSITSASSIRLASFGAGFPGDVTIGDGRLDFPLVVPGGPFPPLICACIGVAGGSAGRLIAAGRSDLFEFASDGGVRPTGGFDAGLSIASLVGLAADLASQPGIAISRAGDIYLDLSMADIDRLTVKAGKSIFVMGSDSLPVPEPGTGLLFGLGLISLAIPGRRLSVSASA